MVAAAPTCSLSPASPLPRRQRRRPPGLSRFAGLAGLVCVSFARFAAAMGPEIRYASPPSGAAGWPRACSVHHPICIHSAPGTTTTLATLASADRAWEVLTETLEAPAPDTDADGAWHIYLADQAAGVEGSSTALPTWRDPVARFDRASSFALVDGRTATGCGLDLAVARAVARASLWRSAPATDEGSARAQAEALARLAVPCAAGGDDLAEFQADPERTLVDPTVASYDRGAGLFFDWVDATFGAEPGGVITGLWALSPTRTPGAAWRWAEAPTGFDVLRASLQGALGTDSTLDDVLVRFAVDRGTAAPPVRVAWHIPWPAAARRFASPVPVSPTGASYVLVDLAGAPPAAKLRVEAAWEDFGRMRWAIVKLDARGRALAVVPVTSLRLGTQASMTVELLDGVDRILVVGVNVGSTEHPFDPGQGEWEPHGWLLTLEGG